MGVDRRLHRGAGLWRRLGEDSGSAAPPGDGEERAARLPGKARVEGLLEAVDPDRRVGRRSPGARGPEGRPLPRVPTSPVTSIAARADRVRAGVGRPLGQGSAVGGEDRRPRRQLDPALQVLAAAQPGEEEAPAPGDPAFGEGQVDVGVDGTEGDRVGDDRDRHGRHACGLGCFPRGARLQRAQRRHPFCFAVCLGEFGDPDRPFRGGVQLPYTSRRIRAAPRLRRIAWRHPSRETPPAPPPRHPG